MKNKSLYLMELNYSRGSLIRDYVNYMNDLMIEKEINRVYFMQNNKVYTLTDDNNPVKFGELTSFLKLVIKFECEIETYTS